jgi:tetratricopeptide (TPR) repeat protein
MGSIKPVPKLKFWNRSPGSAAPFLLWFCAAALVLPPLYGQGGGKNLGTEIQNLEKSLGNRELPAAERQKSLARLARLYELSGTIEKAADAWSRAAAADPGKRNDAFLLNGAACLAALGEWDSAGAAVQAVLRAGGPDLYRARLLGAQIEAFGSRDTGALISLLNDPGFEDRKSVIYYTLWKITGNESWKTRLGAEYPQSPEGRIASGAGPGNISAAPGAMWILFPGRESITLENVSPAPPAGAPVPPRQDQDAVRVLQTGLFGSEANARNQAERLRAAGFSPFIAKRSVSGNEYWAVQVPAGGDLNAAILRLKNSGFESFPVY